MKQIDFDSLSLIKHLSTEYIYAMNIICNRIDSNG